MKKSISILLSFLLIAFSCPIIVNAAEAETFTSGKYTYQLKENGNAVLLHISGEDISVVEIPAEIDGITVEEIAGEGRLFDYPLEINEIILPDTIKEIRDDAFSYMRYLTKVELNEGLTRIGRDGFENCQRLKKISIPSTVKSFGDFCFDSCKMLEEVEFRGEEIYFIPENAFSGCNALKKINLPESITSIGISAFSGCSSLTEIKLPKAVKTIKDSTFEGCSGFKSFTVPDHIKEIESSAFSYCNNLEEIDFGKGVNTIKSRAFENCFSLKSINIPDNVTSCGTGAFEGCKALTDIKIGSGLTTISQWMFKNCTSLREFRIPFGITYIDRWSFNSCTSLEDIYIPKSVKTMRAEIFDDNSTVRIHGYAGSTAQSYAKNNNLTFVEINGGITGVDTEIHLVSDGITLRQFKPKKLEFTVDYPAGDSVFQSSDDTVVTVDDKGVLTGQAEGTAVVVVVNGNATATVTVRVEALPVDVTEEHEQYGYKFRYYDSDDEIIRVRITGFNENLKTADIPSTINGYSVTEISDGAFRNCTSLINASVPEGVTKIDREAFKNCTSLLSITLPKSLISVSERAFTGCEKLRVIRLADLRAWNKVQFFNDGDSFSAPNLCPNTVYVNGKKLEELEITENFGEINEYFLRNCTSLKRLVIGEGITKINHHAFSGCTSLEYISLPDSLTYIGTAFSGCKSLKTVTIPKNVNTISSRAFEKCDSLESVVFNAYHCENFGYKFDPIFDACTNLKSFEIAEDVSYLPYYLLKNTSDNIEVIGVKGSFAQQYAEDNGYTFIEKTVESSTSDLTTEPAETLTPTTQPITDGQAASTVTTATEKATVDPEQTTAPLNTEPKESTAPTASTQSTNPSEATDATASTDSTAPSEATNATAQADSTAPIVTKPTEPKPAPSFSAKSKTLKAGESTKLILSGAKLKAYSSSDKKTVRIKNGKACALRKGKAIITAILKNGSKLKTEIKVTSNPKLSRKKLTIQRGKAVKIRIIGKSPLINNKYKNTKYAKITSAKTAKTLRIKALRKGKSKLVITVNGVKLKLTVIVN